MPDVNADGVDARHFCHHARYCLLKAVCDQSRGTHRRRGVHCLDTVDRRGPFLIPLFAHCHYLCAMLSMHTFTVAVRSTISSVRRRSVDEVHALMDLAVFLLGFLLLLSAHRHSLIRYLHQSLLSSSGLAICTCRGGGSL